MDSVKHTPGPWEWVMHDYSMASLEAGDSIGWGELVVVSVGPCEACAERRKENGWRWGGCGTPSEPDALLIAAAPDLLEALQKVRDGINDSFFHPGLGELVDAAIAKTTGVSNG